MSRMLRIETLEEMGAHPAAEAVRLRSGEDLEVIPADARWALVHDGQLVARCSLWWKETPRYRGQPVGFVGHYAAADAASAAPLINHACQQLQKQGCHLAFAPIDGSTWQSYRFITDVGTEPRFLFEPDHPDDWPNHFRTSGFESLAQYFSAVNTNLPFKRPEIQNVARELTRQAVVIRPLDESRFDDELHSIYHLATQAFRQHLLFSPIAKREFEQYYYQLRTWVPLHLTLVAEQRGRLVGFVFAVPDLLQERRGDPIKTVIVKSLAVVPDSNLWGLGQILLERVHHLARQQGLTRAIYALVHDRPPDRKRAALYGRRIRNYTLFSKVLRR